ncbi:hypothetical protein DQ04_12551000 [Trypanosoma grayi]|uniref:hypothetical protein n=1 Tax=Trypanosoma grayi TaxID=71804 RepID=UPI0004F4B30B|nr:hypothetical protein DQ04_12551000 [Trypanosoma grayi]KEG06725.1 hypothetical protein DQ04_12551000 [Trypanosoma grayi]
MKMVRHVVCLLVLAWCCCTALCVSAAVPDSAADPVLKDTAAQIAAKEAEIAALTKDLDAATKDEGAVAAVSEAVKEAKTAAEAVKQIVTDVKVLLDVDVRYAVKLASVALADTYDAALALAVLAFPMDHDDVPSKFLYPKELTTEKTTQLAEAAVANATEAKAEATKVLLNVTETEEKIKAIVQKGTSALQRVTDVAGKYEKGTEAFRSAVKAAEEAATASLSAAEQYLKEMKNVTEPATIISETANVLLTFGKRVLEITKQTDTRRKPDNREEFQIIMGETYEGGDAIARALGTTLYARDAAHSVSKAVDAVITSATGAAQTVQSELDKAQMDKTKAGEKLTKLRAELEQLTLTTTAAVGGGTATHPSSTGPTTNPALVPDAAPVSNGNIAESWTLLAQHTDGSDVHAWVSTPLMLLLMACVAVL